MPPPIAPIDARARKPFAAAAALWRALLLIVALAGAGGAAAQAPARDGPHIRHAIAAESPVAAPGAAVTLALVMQPEPGWHGYWKNGGDAGFGLEMTWDLPPGVSIGELAYPVPSTLVVAGLMNHVYEAPYAILAPLTLSPGLAEGTRLPIRARASWLACTDRICVPESGSFAIDVIVGRQGVDPAVRARFDRWRAALPQPLASRVSYALDGDSLRFGIPLPAALALERPHLFVETVRADQPGAAQSFARVGDRLIVQTRPGPGIRPGRDIAAVLAIAPGRGLSFVAEPGYVPPPPDPEFPAAPAPAGAGVFLAALLGAIAGGLLLNIMPCVFPIISLKALALARAGGDERAVRREGLAYTAGAVLSALALGAAMLLLRAGGEAVGWAFQLQSAPSVLLLTVLAMAIAANLAGLFEVPVLAPGGRARRESDGDGGAEPHEPSRAAFATGALAAFVATPCSGPFLGAALGATLVLPAWAALPVFGGLGLGLALPFLLLALVPALRRRLPRPGPWMERLRRWLAVPMALTALALVWLLGRQAGVAGWLVGLAAIAATLGLGWWAGRLQRRGAHAGAPFLAMAAIVVPLSLLLPAPAPRDGDAPGRAVGIVGAEAWSEARVAALRREGRPLFVYVTADWCLSCKANEAAAIDRAETAAAFRAAGVTVLAADWTRGDAAITRELARHGRNSVPLYLWYPAGGGAPEILPQVLTRSMLVDRARRR